jgi:ABC-type Fe3+-hydroxamate transport system substrate-binding protein
VSREAIVAGCAFALGASVFGLSRAARPGRAGARDDASPGAARRVVSLAPSITEIVFELLGEEAPSRVVGVSEGVTWPPEAVGIESVGGYLDVDFERVLELRPDLLLLQGMHARVHSWARRRRIPVRRMDAASIEDIRRNARRLGAWLGVPERAEELIGKIDAELDQVRRGAGPARPVRAFLHVAQGSPLPEDPLLTVGGGTFLSELLAIAGAENVFAGSPELYPTVSREAVIARAPEVVIVAAPGVEVPREAARSARGEWSRLLAHGAPVRVEFLTADYSLIPGPRVGSLAREMRSLVAETSESRPGGKDALP